MAQKKRGKRSSREARIAEMGEVILDIAGAAKLLGVSRSTMYRLARAGRVPGTKLGREWRFTRRSLIHAIESGAGADQLVNLINKHSKGSRRRK